MATENTGVLKYLEGGGSFPSIDFGMFGGAWKILLFCVLLGIIVLLIRRFTDHRIWVEELIVVKDGLVSRGGRYAEAYDKHTKLKYLRPMFGKDRLPDFPADCFQKTTGIPFIGVKRELTLIFSNKHSPIAIVPTNDLTVDGEVRHHTVKRWSFMNEKEMFLKKLRFGEIAYYLMLAAPTVIILGAIVFFAFTMFVQAGIYKDVGDEILAMLDAMQNVIKAQGG